MKVLYVTAACLTKNTSANMSHNGFVKGFLDCGCDVDIIMANNSWGEEDRALIKWEKANYYEFNSVSFADKLRGRFKRVELHTTDVLSSSNNISDSNRKGMRQQIRSVLKAMFYLFFPKDPVYPLDKQWLKSAIHFQSDKEYDLVVTNSSPAASHKLVSELLKKGRIKSKKWIQIWEDPWYHDLYGGNSEEVLNEEHFLLKEAEKVYYVSPLTLMYQKQFFPDCAMKMNCVPLPYYEFEKKDEESTKPKGISFGYFGDYYSQTRNLVPFYKALRKSGYAGFIYGDSNVHFEETENIEISGRVTLDKLSAVQNNTSILVHLCNLRGGQIPGKIYHYSATIKPILFILDGTLDEKKEIKDFFEKYDRYYFCDNDIDSILVTMQIIIEEDRQFLAVNSFEPKEVVKKIIHEEENTVC